MNEKDQKHNLNSVGTLESVMCEKFTEYVNTRDDLDELISLYNDDYVSELYDMLSSEISHIYSNEMSKLLDKKTIFNIKTNSNHHNVKLNAYFRIHRVERINEIQYGFSLNDDGTQIIINPGQNSWTNVFRIIFLKYDDKLNKYVDIKSSLQITDNVRLSDITMYEKNQKGFLNIQTLHNKRKELDSLLADKAKEIDSIKEEITNVDYVINYMDKNKITLETISSIKSGLILETLKESETDDAVDVKTNISEIVNLEF